MSGPVPSLGTFCQGWSSFLSGPDLGGWDFDTIPNKKLSLGSKKIKINVSLYQEMKLNGVS